MQQEKPRGLAETCVALSVLLFGVSTVALSAGIGDRAERSHLRSIAARRAAATHLPPGFAEEVFQERSTPSDRGIVREWLDASGRLLALTEPGRGTLLRTYDQSGRLYSETFLPANLDATQATAPAGPWEAGTSALSDRTYITPESNGTGGGGDQKRLSDAVNATASVHFDYAPDGQVTSESIAIDGITFEVRRERMESAPGLYRLSDSQGGAFQEARDAFGRLLWYAQGKRALFARAYSSTGNVTSVSMGDGARIDYDLDDRGDWNSKKITMAGTREPPRIMEVGRDSRRRVTDLRVDGKSMDTSRRANSSFYSNYYDALGRVVKSVTAGGTRYFAYLVGGPYAVLDEHGTVEKRRLVSESGMTPFSEAGVEILANGDRQYFLPSGLAGVGLVYKASDDRRPKAQAVLAPELAIACWTTYTTVCSGDLSSWTCNTTSWTSCFYIGDWWSDPWSNPSAPGNPSGGGGVADGEPLNSEQQQTVNAASADAYNRVSSKETCAGLYGQYGSCASGYCGIENLTHATYVQGAAGGPSCPTRSVVAATAPGSLTVYLCPPFFKATQGDGSFTPTPTDQALVLIHESLHSNGLTGHAGLTTAGFQDTVVKPACN